MYRLIIMMLLTVPLLAQEKMYNQTDANGLKQGAWQKYHPGDTVLRYQGTFENDHPKGTFKHYFPNGALQVKMTYSSANRSFSRMYYQEEERLMAIGPYQDQEKDSTWIYYDYFGNKIAEEYYINGKPYGNWKKFFPNGQIMEEKYFENSFENGAFKQYFSSGILYREGIYVNGALEGAASFYHENGILKSEGLYRKDARTGIWKSYDKDGKLIDERKYVNGVPEERESDFIHEDTSKYFVKDKFTVDDIFEEDYMAIPDEKEEKVNKKGKKK